MGFASNPEVMKTLSQEIQWFDKQPLHMSTRLSRCICLCATENMIQQQDDPERMRAFLLVAVFFDQLVHTRYPSIHEDFYRDFTVPKLLARGGCGCATPDWLLSHEHGFDMHVDWRGVENLATGAFYEVLGWIQRRRPIGQGQFSSLVRKEVIDTFEAEHQDMILQAFHLKKDEALH